MNLGPNKKVGSAFSVIMRAPILITLILLPLSLFLWSWFFGIITVFMQKPYITFNSDIDANQYVGAATSALTTVGGLILITKMRIDWGNYLLNDRVLQNKQDEDWDNRLRIANQAYAECAALIGELNVVRAVAGIRSLTNLSDSFVWDIQNTSRLDEEQKTEYIEEFKQRCVNLLCATIRAPYPKLEAPEREMIQSEVFAVIKSRTDTECNTNNPELSWSDCDFDLHETAINCPVHLQNCHFKSKLDLWGTSFERSVYCSSSVFNDVNFNGVSFLGKRTLFDNCVFSNASFEGNCTFTNEASFENTTFESDVYFGCPVTDPGTVSYAGVSNFTDISFSDGTFKHTLIFQDSEISGELNLNKVKAQSIKFDKVKCKKTVYFSDAEMKSGFEILDSIFLGSFIFDRCILGTKGDLRPQFQHVDMRFDGSCFNSFQSQDTYFKPKALLQLISVSGKTAELQDFL